MLALCFVEEEGKYGFYSSKNIQKLKGNIIGKSYHFDKTIRIAKSEEIKVGSYGIFKIKLNSQKYFFEEPAQATFKSELQIIEICKLENVNNLEDLPSLLFNGINEKDLKHLSLGQKIFFTSENLLDESKKYLGFLCDVSDIDNYNSKFFLKKTVNRLLKYHLLKSNIITLKNDFYGDILISKEIYDLNKEKNTSDFYSIEEINNEDSIIDEKNIDVEENNQLESIAKNQDIFEKSQKEFGDVILSNNIDKDIIEKIVNDRFTSLQKNIDSKIDKEYLKKIVENQLESIYSEKDLIVKQFEEKLFSIKTDIDNKIDKKDFDVVNSKLINLENDIKLTVNEDLNDFLKKISDLDSKIKKFEKDNKDYFDLLSASHDELEKKLNNFESNSKNQENLLPHLISSENFQKDYSFTKQVINNCEDLFGIFDENLYSIGFSKSYDFGCFLYLLYKKNIPLFLLGPNGEKIADVFSITMFGKPAGCLECFGDYSISVKKEISGIHDKVIIIKNPFHWISNIPDILQSFDDKYFFIVYPFIEDAVIEPQSLYNYMIPFFTEFFFESIKKNNSSEFIVCEFAKDFEDYKFESLESSEYDEDLKKMKVKNIYKEYFKSIVLNLKNIELYEIGCIEYLLLFSYAYLSGRTNLFFNKIEYKNEVTPDLKKYFDTFKIEEE